MTPAERDLLLAIAEGLRLQLDDAAYTFRDDGNYREAAEAIEESARLVEASAPHAFRALPWHDDAALIGKCATCHGAEEAPLHSSWPGL